MSGDDTPQLPPPPGAAPTNLDLSGLPDQVQLLLNQDLALDRALLNTVSPRITILQLRSQALQAGDLTSFTAVPAATLRNALAMRFIDAAEALNNLRIQAYQSADPQRIAAFGKFDARLKAAGHSAGEWYKRRSDLVHSDSAILLDRTMEEYHRLLPALQDIAANDPFLAGTPEAARLLRPLARSAAIVENAAPASPRIDAATARESLHLEELRATTHLLDHATAFLPALQPGLQRIAARRNQLAHYYDDGVSEEINYARLVEATREKLAAAKAYAPHIFKNQPGPTDIELLEQTVQNDSPRSHRNLAVLAACINQDLGEADMQAALHYLDIVEEANRQTSRNLAALPPQAAPDAVENAKRAPMSFVRRELARFNLDDLEAIHRIHGAIAQPGDAGGNSELSGRMHNQLKRKLTQLGSDIHTQRQRTLQPQQAPVGGGNGIKRGMASELPVHPMRGDQPYTHPLTDEEIKQLRVFSEEVKKVTEKHGIQDAQIVLQFPEQFAAYAIKAPHLQEHLADWDPSLTNPEHFSPAQIREHEKLYRQNLERSKHVRLDGYGATFATLEKGMGKPEKAKPSFGLLYSDLHSMRSRGLNGVMHHEASHLVHQDAQARLKLDRHRLITHQMAHLHAYLDQLGSDPVESSRLETALRSVFASPQDLSQYLRRLRENVAEPGRHLVDFLNANPTERHLIDAGIGSRLLSLPEAEEEHHRLRDVHQALGDSYGSAEPPAPLERHPLLEMITPALREAAVDYEVLSDRDGDIYRAHEWMADQFALTHGDDPEGYVRLMEEMAMEFREKMQGRPIESMPEDLWTEPNDQPPKPIDWDPIEDMRRIQLERGTHQLPDHRAKLLRLALDNGGQLPRDVSLNPDRDWVIARETPGTPEYKIQQAYYAENLRQAEEALQLPEPAQPPRHGLDSEARQLVEQQNLQRTIQAQLESAAAQIEPDPDKRIWREQARQQPQQRLSHSEMSGNLSVEPTPDHPMVEMTRGARSARLAAGIQAANAPIGLAMGVHGLVSKLEAQSAYREDVKAGGLRRAAAYVGITGDGGNMAIGAVDSVNGIRHAVKAGQAAAAASTAPTAVQALAEGAEAATGVSKALGVAGRIAGRAAIPVAIVIGAADATAAVAAKDGHRAVRAVGGTAGGIAGGILASMGSTALMFSVFPGAGTVVGAGVGLVVGLVGAFGGGWAVGELADHAWGEQADAALKRPKPPSFGQGDFGGGGAQGEVIPPGRAPFPPLRKSPPPPVLVPPVPAPLTSELRAQVTPDILATLHQGLHAPGHGVYKNHLPPEQRRLH